MAVHQPRGEASGETRPRQHPALNPQTCRLSHPHRGSRYHHVSVRIVSRHHTELQSSRPRNSTPRPSHSDGINPAASAPEPDPPLEQNSR